MSASRRKRNKKAQIKSGERALSSPRAKQRGLGNLPGLKLESEADRLTRENWINRESSWLEFNRRVLYQAQDVRNPLLERFRFLSIFSSNLDEFFMKRVGGLQRQLSVQLSRRSVDNFTPQELLKEIHKISEPMIETAVDCFEKSLRPALKENNVELLDWKDVRSSEKKWLNAHFEASVLPILNPLSVDPGHPFPFIRNLSTSLGVSLCYPGRENKFFARVKIPGVLPQWVLIDSDENSNVYRYVHLQDLITENLNSLFPGMEIKHVMAFRITRNADIERDEEDAEDLLEMIEEELKERRFADIIRLEHGPSPDQWMIQFIIDEIGIPKSHVYQRSSRILDFTSFNEICDLDIPALKFPPFFPVIPIPLEDEEVDIFSTIRNQDQLVHHPFESFNSTVERFVKAATEDPSVLALKMTLYRTSIDSPFIRLLIKAAESGKQVVCLVELKARFDEERNIGWAQALENAGVHVVYGVVGLKTHTKMTLVVRKEGHHIRSYVHIGSGNYHSRTARLYTDLGLFTSDERITSEVVSLFHYLTGRSLKKDYRALLVAPINIRSRFEEKIDAEIANSKSGKPAYIFAKMNSLEDRDMIRKLYEASCTGVKIDLIVRGFCCLKPGVRGVSDNIRVTSIVGRFLEHSRIFYFQNGAEKPQEGEFYIGSADWMYRNLNNRVEAIAPIFDLGLKARIWSLIQTMLKDQRLAWDLQSNGSYKLRNPDRTDLEGCHDIFINKSKKRK